MQTREHIYKYPVPHMLTNNYKYSGLRKSNIRNFKTIIRPKGDISMKKGTLDEKVSPRRLFDKK